MAVIYGVTVEPSGKENIFRITWHKQGSEIIESFEGAVEVVSEEIQRFWHQSRYQLDIGRKLFRFLDGDARHLHRALQEAEQQGEPLHLYLYPCNQILDWPWLRLFSSGMSLDAIVTKNQQFRPQPGRMVHAYLKNSQVKVLAEGFVGRRRQLQQCMRTLYHDVDKSGVLILGTAGLGKSCLAGKICEQFSDHILIIIHGKLNTIILANALSEAFNMSLDVEAQRIISQKTEMREKLADLCATSFRKKNYLLLLDDFDVNLEGANKGNLGQLLPEAAELLGTLLYYLPYSGKMTQIIITSRYCFSITEQDRDPVSERLEKIWLTGFNEAEQTKKARALKNIFNYVDRSLVPQLVAAGHGNPRLMEWIDLLVGQMPGAEVPQLLEAIKDKKEQFIRNHVLRELLRGGVKT